MEKPVPVTYDPVSGKWAAENPINVSPGITRIVWKVAVVPDAAGDIYFGTAPDFQGITFAPGWPGTEPKGDDRVWSSTLRDTMTPGNPPQVFEYTVNAMYQTDHSKIAQPVSWDPDVEEGGGPPPAKHI